MISSEFKLRVEKRGSTVICIYSPSGMILYDNRRIGLY